jgi:hypothetical protein
MIDLNTVVQAIAEKSLKLVRTADSIRVEGDCSAELASAIQHHAASLLPFVAVDPESAEEVAEQQATADSDCIRQQLNDFAEWTLQHHPWASSDYTEKHIDGRLTVAVDSRNPSEVATVIALIQAELDAIDWATHLFPLSMETEAKHVAGQNPPTEDDPDCPF